MTSLFLALVSPDPDTALAVARACSPRVARYGTTIVADVSGCARTIGSPATIAREVMTLAAAHDLSARVGVAPTMVAAWLVAQVEPGAIVQAQPGSIVVAVGTVARTLAVLPLRRLDTTIDLDPELTRVSNLKASYAERLAVFEQWGMTTIGEVAKLPRRDVHARMGSIGVRLHQAACGEDAYRFVPLEEVPPFIAEMTLEWPIEGLEPLAFVLGRLSDQIAAQLVRADRGAIVLRTRVRLVTRETHERVLCLPAPIADARVLRTLVLLDLESHPPNAGIDAVTLQVDVMPGRIVQGSLLAPTVPTPEDLATLTARLVALVGEARVGAPRVLDTFDERRIGMESFAVSTGTTGTTGSSGTTGSRSHLTRSTYSQRAKPNSNNNTDDGVSSFLGPVVPDVTRRHLTSPDAPKPVLRRFRLPIVAKVTQTRGVPVRVETHVRTIAGGDVVRRAGPWRTSGEWWTEHGGWDRDEWDVALTDGAIYRIARDRRTGQWVMEGVLD